MSKQTSIPAYCSLLAFIVGHAVGHTDPADHPRLLVNVAGLRALRAKAEDNQPNRYGFATQSAWHELKNKADRALRAEPYHYSVNIPLSGNRRAGVWEYTLSDATPPRHDDTPNYPPWTAMFQERSDSITTRLIHLAFAYLITGERPYAECARDMALHLAKWDGWTDPSYGAGRIKACLDTGHCTYAASMVYDWCFDALTDTERTELCNAIIEKGIKPCLAGVDRYPPDTNGYAVVLTGAAMGSVAVLPEAPEATAWLENCIAKIRVSLDRGGKDGGAFEGPMYGTYLLDSLAKSLAALEAAKIEHDLFEHPYLRSLTRSCVDLLAPDTRTIPCFSDGSPTAGYPQIMGLLAHRGDREAAWYIEQISAVQVRSIYDFLRFDPDKLRSRQPQWNPSSPFVDIGYASLRDGFNASAPSLFLKSGPLENRIGHNHFDHNSFVISHLGEWIMCDRGYHSRYDPHERKFSLGTLGHSTVVLDVDDAYLAASEVPMPGHEQVRREGGQIASFIPGIAFDLVTGEAAQAYNPKGRTVLDTYERTIVYLKPHAFVVLDHLSAPEPHRYSFLFHTDGAGVVEADGNTFRISRTVGEIVGQMSASTPLTLHTGPYPQAERYGPFLRAESAACKEVKALTFLCPRANQQPVFLRNGGFEKGMSGWRPRANQDLPNHTIVEESPASGTKCAQIVRSGYYYSTKFKVAPGETVTARARIRTTELPAGKGATMTLYFWRGKKSFARKRVGPFAHADWQEHELSEVVPPDTEEVCLALEFFAPGTGWFDAAVVEAPVQIIPTVEAEVLAITPRTLDVRLGPERYVVRAAGAASGNDALASDADVAVLSLNPNGRPLKAFIKNGTFITWQGREFVRSASPLCGEIVLSNGRLTGTFQETANPHAVAARQVEFVVGAEVVSATLNGKPARVESAGGRSTIRAAQTRNRSRERNHE